MPEYAQQRNFQAVIRSAMDACKASGNSVYTRSVQIMERKPPVKRTKVSAARQTIKELGGVMPEDLAAPERRIKQLECRQRRLEKENK